jgi:two-component system response regulator DegU
MQIMIVDDNEKIREFLITILVKKMMGKWDIIQFANGFDAYMAYKNSIADIVIMDIQMPVMNGFEATKKILDFHKEAKIIMMTQFIDPDYRKRAFEIGAVQYVTKDNLLEITNVINQLYNN